MLSIYDQSKIFNRNVMIKVADSQESKILGELIDMNNSQIKNIYNSTFEQLTKSYRNDYFYRSIIATKIFLSRHSLEKSILMHELRIGCVKADLVILNGSSTAYEIKSDVDSFERLEKQLQFYLQVFDYNYVVLPDYKLNKLGLFPANVGVICLTNNNTFKIVKKAKSNVINVNPNTIFDTLRINECQSRASSTISRS